MKTSWWFQPIWKIIVKMGSSSPGRGEHIKYLKFHHRSENVSHIKHGNFPACHGGVPFFQVRHFRANPPGDKTSPPTGSRKNLKITLPIQLTYPLKSAWKWQREIFKMLGTFSFWWDNPMYLFRGGKSLIWTKPNHLRIPMVSIFFVSRPAKTDIFTVDGRNPAPVEGTVVYPIIHRVLYIPGGAGFLPSTLSPRSFVTHEWEFHVACVTAIATSPWLLWQYWYPDLCSTWGPAQGKAKQQHMRPQTSTLSKQT